MFGQPSYCSLGENPSTNIFYRCCRGTEEQSYLPWDIRQRLDCVLGGEQEPSLKKDCNFHLATPQKCSVALKKLGTWANLDTTPIPPATDPKKIIKRAWSFQKSNPSSSSSGTPKKIVSKIYKKVTTSKSGHKSKGIQKPATNLDLGKYKLITKIEQKLEGSIETTS